MIKNHYKKQLNTSFLYSIHALFIVITMSSFERAIVLGGKGNMASFLMPYLPSPTIRIDTKDFENIGGYLSQLKLVRKRSSVELRHSCRESSSDNINTLFVLSVPANVYEDTTPLPNGNQLASIIGISGRGQRRTLFVHQTSIHTKPAALLDPVSGVVMGIHLLHGPTATNLANETVIITATPKKKSHDLYNSALDRLSSILRKNMSYGHIFQMDPTRHDKIMSNIQFLSHSMILILVSALIDSDFEINDSNYSELSSHLLIMAGRMFKQEVHVLRGIAQSNIHNISIIEQLGNIGDCNGHSTVDWLNSAILKFAEIRDKSITNTGMSTTEIAKISTPISRVRDGMMVSAQRANPTGRGRLDLFLSAHTHKYIKAVKGPYDAYFDNLKNKVAPELAKLDFEKMAMTLYQRLKG